MRGLGIGRRRRVAAAQRFGPEAIWVLGTASTRTGWSCRWSRRWPGIRAGWPIALNSGDQPPAELTPESLRTHWGGSLGRRHRVWEPIY